ncbi:MAG TPA: RodZ domain-containing protein, partial [Holophagaceae bacterium]|nr:RodZ domain-containing protein [Holophagaceae bacterium]
ADGVKLARSLQVSDPWKLRVKAPFQLSLSNAGVVQVEVAGKPVATGASVGQPWSGRFDENGVWRRPRPQPVPVEPLTQEPAPEQPPPPPAPDGTEPAPEPGANP